MPLATSTSTPAKKLKDQRILDVGGGPLVRGWYVELQPASVPDAAGAACFRRIDQSGRWADAFLLYDAGAPRWCLAASPWEVSEPLAWSGPALSADPCEATGWQCPADSSVEIRIASSSMAELPQSEKYGHYARQFAKDDFKHPWKLTRFRCRAEQCKIRTASCWGLADEGELYGHLCLYHRTSAQYYDKHRRYWDQGIAEALNARPDTEENLVNRFEAVLRRHDYEATTKGRKVHHHTRNLLYTSKNFKGPLTRQLVLDPSLMEEVKAWPEDKSCHGHYTVSLRWLKRVIEILDVEEILATLHLDDDLQGAQGVAASWEIHTPPPARKPEAPKVCAGPPAAGAAAPDEVPTPPAKARADPPKIRAGPPPVDAEALKRGAGGAGKRALSDKAGGGGAKRPHLDLDSARYVQRVATAGDPYVAVLPLGGDVSQPRGARGPAARGAQDHRGRPLEAAPDDMHHMAKDFARVAYGDRRVAERYAEWEEHEGPCAGVFQTSSDAQRHAFLDGASGEDQDHLWLWAFTGMRPREKLVRCLVARHCREPGDHSHLLKRLLCAASSPHAIPLDVLGLLGDIFRLPDASLRWKMLEPLARHAFRPGSTTTRRLLLEAKYPLLMKLVAFGGVLGKLMSSWSDADEKADAWWRSFLDDLTGCSRAEWMHRAAFAAGYQWNWNDSTAPAKLQELSQRAASCDSSSRLLEFQSLLAHARRRSQEQAAKASRALDGMDVDDPRGDAAAKAGEDWDCVDIDARGGGALNAGKVWDCIIEVGDDEDDNQAAPKDTAASGSPGARVPPPPAVQRDEAVATHKLSAEQLAVIEENRKRALEKRQRMQLGAQPEGAPAGEVPRPVATPQAVATGPECPPQAAGAPAGAGAGHAAQAAPEVDPRIIDMEGHSSIISFPVRGSVRFRCDHAKGFYVRIGDATGEVDVKFWGVAAEHFLQHPALCKGAEIRVRGLYKKPLSQAQLDFAPCGRSFEFHVNRPGNVDVELLTAPAPSAPKVSEEMTLDEALKQPHGTRVTVVAWAVEVEDLEVKKDMALRTVWLAPDPGQRPPNTRWTLWKNVATDYGPKQLLKCHLRIRGAMVKAVAFGPLKGKKELTGCFQTGGGIEVLPQ
mmetsp:Transcript_17922/g.50770  ORF Transcript_17922/g.50770 Transcript_17922/m.50770 type:complete len:1110 (-) Transcript_17922:68-3397(-)